MYKKSTSVVSIITKSVGIFFEKLPSFLKYIAYPVLGQLAGIMVCFAPFLISPDPKNVNILLVFMCLIAGLVLFVHAFWRFLLVSAGLVLISRQIVENEPLQEFNHYTKVFEKRSKEYIVFILLAAFIVPVLLLLVAAVAFVLFLLVFKEVNFGFNLPPEVVSQISAALAAKGLNADAATFVNLLMHVFYGILFALFVFVLVSSVFGVSTETFVLSPNLTPLKSILKCAKLSFKNYFSNFGLLLTLFAIGFIIGQIVELIIIGPMFSESLYLKYAAYKDIISMLRASVAIAIGSIFMPFGVLCRTWWYLRMEKENALKTARND